ncbi:MAG: DUF805 domain-containing protein [Alphaproteobacteria bacterium]|nr:DUF805 domain-containing protein [Alphaproteobacteria bacterium]
MGRRVRGEVIDVSGDGDALVSGDDGVRYAFATRDVRGFIVQRGDRIDFVPVDGIATEVVLLSSGPAVSAAGTGYSARPDAGETSPWGYFVRCMKKYVDGYGRARRSEYWYFVLFRVLLVGGTVFLGAIVSGLTTDGGEDVSPAGMIFMVLGGLTYVGTIIPNLCAMIRRFHDVGLSGWLVLLNAIPYLGSLVTFIICVLPSEARPNTHGPVPGSSRRATAEVFS